MEKRQRPVVYASQIRMQRSQYKGTFVIVEGRDDNLFCRQQLSLQSCKIVVVGGKSNVIDTISILDQDKFSGVVGIVDADFDHIEERYFENINIIVTDFHDLECIQLQASGLESLVNEFGSQPKLDSFNQDIRDAILSAASPIGYLRLYSQRNKLKLRFTNLNYSSFVDRITLKTNCNLLIREVKNRSNLQNIPNAVLAEGVREIKELKYDPWQICTGTDLLGVLSVGLRHILGNNNAAQVQMDRLRQVLRVAYKKEDFEKTKMSHALREWENHYKPYLIF